MNKKKSPSTQASIAQSTLILSNICCITVTDVPQIKAADVVDHKNYVETSMITWINVDHLLTSSISLPWLLPP
jgi:hypothetical protein